MTSKDELPLVHEINELLRVCETDNDLARCIMDVLKERGLYPPVPDDVAEALETVRQAIEDRHTTDCNHTDNLDCSLKTSHELHALEEIIYQSHLSALEIIRAASTPSADAERVHDAEVAKAIERCELYIGHFTMCGTNPLKDAMKTLIKAAQGKLGEGGK